MDLKNHIINASFKIGFTQCRIGSLAHLSQAQHHLEKWINLGLAGKMDYLKRNPQLRTNPQLLFPQAKSVILLSANYYTKPNLRPLGYYGKVANYATGLDYHQVLPNKVKLLVEQIKMVDPRIENYQCVTDSTPLYEIPLGIRHGLGFKGKNSLIIAPLLKGSYNFSVELFTNIELEPDTVYNGTCGKCFACGTNCPTLAISTETGIDSNKCISYLTIENKEAIPLTLRPKIKNWVFGCDICQEICPYNQKQYETSFPEFKPESGIGHYLNLMEILKIKTNQEFLAKFRHTAISRAKRTGLIRNSLTVMGNILANFDNVEYIDSVNLEQGLDGLYQFTLNENTPMLIEHSAWALSKHPYGLNYLTKIYDQSSDPESKKIIKSYLLNQLEPNPKV